MGWFSGAVAKEERAGQWAKVPQKLLQAPGSGCHVPAQAPLTRMALSGAIQSHTMTCIHRVPPTTYILTELRLSPPPHSSKLPDYQG